MSMRASQHRQIWPLQIALALADTGVPSSTRLFSSQPMDRTPSKTRAALWMAGWLALMLIMAIAGREATRELNVFQIMEVRSILGFVLLYPLIRIERRICRAEDDAAAASISRAI